MDSKTKLGKNIKEQRINRSYTQTELASKVGMNANYLAKVERGEVMPSIEMLKKIAKVLKVKVSDLINF